MNKLNEQKSSIVVFASTENSERVIKVLRSFGVHPLQIPADMPQNPSIAYTQSQSKVKELESRIQRKYQKHGKDEVIIVD